MIKFEISGFVKSLQNLERAGDVVESRMRQATKRGLRASGQILKRYVEDSIRAENAIATGEMLRSVEVSSMVSSLDEISIGVGSSVKYASFIEEGTDGGGGLPPVSEIYDWMAIKGMQPSVMGALLIAKKIQSRGLRDDRRPFAKAAKNAESIVRSTFAAEFAAELNF